MMDLLEKLKELGVYEKFMRNCKAQRDSWVGGWDSCGHVMVGNAFTWHYTSEGRDFWKNVNKTLEGYTTPLKDFLKALDSFECLEDDQFLVDNEEGVVEVDKQDLRKVLVEKLKTERELKVALETIEKLKATLKSKEVAELVLKISKARVDLKKYIVTE